MEETISIIVTGKVQGVFFRKYTREKARELAITGTVQNERDGSVSIQATGTAEQLEKFVAWCMHGPPRARVKAADVQKTQLKQFHSFDIL